MAQVIVRRPVEAEVNGLKIADDGNGATLTLEASRLDTVTLDGKAIEAVGPLSICFDDPWELGDLIAQYLRARGRRPGSTKRTRAPKAKPQEKPQEKLAFDKAKEAVNA